VVVAHREEDGVAELDEGVGQRELRAEPDVDGMIGFQPRT
jgi:hypothetical protein